MIKAAIMCGNNFAYVGRLRCHEEKKKRMLCTLCLIRWRSSQIGCDRHSVVASLREGASQENEGVSEAHKKAS